MDFIANIKCDYNDLVAIQEIVRREDLFTARVLPIDGSKDIYQAVNYLLPGACKNFTAIIDRNIYSRVAGFAKDEEIAAGQKSDYQVVAAVMAFCHFANIDFDYGSSLEEFAAHKTEEAVSKELNSFHKLDNISPSFFVDFALGRSTKIPSEAFRLVPDIVGAPAVSEWGKKSNEFEHSYVFMLKIAELQSRDIKPHQRMQALMDWMHLDYFFGSAALLFANYYFSPSRFGKMLKGFSKYDIQNAAWDLALITNWRKRALVGIEQNEPVLLITRDKAMKAIARCLFADTEQELQENISRHWGKKNNYGVNLAKSYDELSKLVAAAPKQRKIITQDAYWKIREDLEKRVLL